MGGAASNATGGSLATAATGGQNILLDKAVGATGVQGGLSGAWNSVTDPIKQNGGILGLPGAAPELAKIQQGTTVADVQGAQQGTANSLASQQALLQALQGQNGLGMQNTAGANQLGLANQLSNANGVGVQQSAIGALQNAANMYGNIAQGQGPNPAQSMLNQSTGQNVANQAALMAGQRGAGANVGLLARQAGQQGAATQQQAVGQGATMQAQQQLNALQGLTGTQQAIGGLGSGLTNQQAGANQQYANQANQIAGQQIATQQANVQNQLANQQSMQNALQGINNANVSNQGNVNTANAGLAQSNAGAKQAVVGGVLQGLGGAMSGVGARGGMVKHMAEGGMSTLPQQNMSTLYQPPVNMNYSTQSNMSALPPTYGPQSELGKVLAENPVNNVAESNDMMKATTQTSKPQYTGSSLEKGTASITGGGLGKLKSALMAQGGKVKAMLSEKEVVVPPSKAKSPQEASRFVSKELATGGGIKASSPDEKAVKKGNSYANDKIPEELEEGSIVIPRSVTQAKDPAKAAAEFVAKVMAKRKVKK